MSPEEDRTRDAVDSEPKRYQLSYSGPGVESVIVYQTGEGIVVVTMEDLSILVNMAVVMWFFCVVANLFMSMFCAYSNMDCMEGLSILVLFDIVLWSIWQLLCGFLYGSKPVYIYVLCIQ